jgi:hypothetical protein
MFEGCCVTNLYSYSNIVVSLGALPAVAVPLTIPEYLGYLHLVFKVASCLF